MVHVTNTNPQPPTTSPLPIITSLFSSIPIGVCSDRSHHYCAYLCYLLGLDYLSLQQLWLTVLTVFIITYPDNFPCGRKPELARRKFSHETVARRGESRLLWRLRHRSPVVFLMVQSLAHASLSSFTCYKSNFNMHHVLYMKYDCFPLYSFVQNRHGVCHG
jgi:hypothetical protein